MENFMEGIGTPDFYALHLLAEWTKDDPHKADKLIRHAITIGKKLHKEIQQERLNSLSEVVKNGKRP